MLKAEGVFRTAMMVCDNVHTFGVTVVSNNQCGIFWPLGNGQQCNMRCAKVFDVWRYFCTVQGVIPVDNFTSSSRLSGPMCCLCPAMGTNWLPAVLRDKWWFSRLKAKAFKGSFKQAVEPWSSMYRHRLVIPAMFLGSSWYPKVWKCDLPAANSIVKREHLQAGLLVDDFSHDCSVQVCKSKRSCKSLGRFMLWGFCHCIIQRVVLVKLMLFLSGAQKTKLACFCCFPIQWVGFSMQLYVVVDVFSWVKCLTEQPIFGKYMVNLDMLMKSVHLWLPLLVFCPRFFPRRLW